MLPRSFTGNTEDYYYDGYGDAMKKVIDRVLGHHGDQEIFVIFQFKLKDAEPLMEKGQVVARQQFVLNHYQFPEIKSEEAEVQKEETESYVKLEAGGTTLTFGKRQGWIDYLDVDGVPMLIDRESIMPEFWRAPTDNDYGARLQNRFAVWKNPQMRLKEFDVDDNEVEATYEMPDVKAELKMTYTLTKEGEVIIREQLKADKEAKISQMFRYGMQLQMPKQYGQIQYYGRGPVENYCDRNSSEFIGVYNNKVADEYYSYVRPQESGNHTVDDGPNKDKKIGRHSGDLVERPLTQVHIQQRQMGLGCVNSWGAWPREEYRVPYQDYDFTFVIKPLK